MKRTARALALVALVALAGCGGGAATSGPLTADASADAALEGSSLDGAGSADAPVEVPPPPGPYARPTYERLSETGLFDDFAAKRVAPGLLAFEPTHKLWSDAAEKRRWVRLPPGTQIDTSDMDHWVFPVGTKLWKEFSLGGVVLETRLIERYGTGPEDYWMGAFVWSPDGADATLAPDGAHDLDGTAHDAPAQKDCGVCHRGEPGRVLGFAAVQLSRATSPPALRDLAALGLLSKPPVDPLGFAVPGDAPTAAALGYLHANCGHCHNENGTAWPDTQMVLRLVVADRDAATSGVFKSIVDKDLTYFRGGDVKKRVAPGAPDASAVIVRMSARVEKVQMPPLATELVDPTGVELVRAWIAALPPP